MAYVEPAFPQEEVDEAGRIIAADFPLPADFHHATKVFNNWRTAHNYPLNGIARALKLSATKVCGQEINPLQRLKRMQSVERKLRARPDISLSAMQDIGGCRAILGSVSEVRALRDLYKAKRQTHVLKQENDYIERPKKDGYRGIHLIYYFVGRGSNKRARIYAQRRMQIEIQIRTTLQHYWATAVETAETFTKTPMKSQRDENTSPWRQFFALVSSCFAHHEGCAMVPKLPRDIEEVIAQLKALESQNHFCDKLDAYKSTVQHVRSRERDKYFVVELDLATREVKIKGFRPSESIEAAAAYDTSEHGEGTLVESKTQSVLVRAEDVSQLKRDYPNYFLDTAEFVARVRQLVA